MGRLIGRHIRHLESCSSTQDAALDLFMQGLIGEGDIIWSDEQENGRGRQGNAWSSERGGFYCSFVLKEGFFERDTSVAMALGVSSLATVRQFCGGALLKWPNDIVYRGKKLGGVLVEKRNGLYVCGIGINARNRIAGIAGAETLTGALGREVFPEEVLQAYIGCADRIFTAEERYITGWFTSSLWGVPGIWVIIADGIERSVEVTECQEDGGIVYIDEGRQRKAFSCEVRCIDGQDIAWR